MLEDIRRGETSVDEGLSRLRNMPFESIGFATIDHHRTLRCGFPEVIYSAGKTPEQVAAIFSRLAKAGGNVLATRAGREHFEAVRGQASGATYHESARCITLFQTTRELTEGLIVLAAAGTSDLPVVEEARVTCEIMGQRTECLYDVGVAGIHRLLARSELLQAARVVVAVAGMDGALPGVVSGMVQAPVIAVPTSVGYGANFQGLAPLLTMLNACAPGVAVVNIDNGFAAGYLAAVMNRLGEKKAE